MSLRSIVLAIIAAMAATLTSIFVINPNPLLYKQLVELGLVGTTSSQCDVIELMGHHHHHHRRDRKHPNEDTKKVNICEDFPPNFPPPDTSTTSVFCVDRNGCCNFTTVQSAVDANVAPIPSPGDVGAQAVAIRISGDQAAFWGCGFFGAQDTLHDDNGRHYFKDCYIQGSIDFIFGDARSLYESCQLVSMASPVAAGQRMINGVVTAHGRTSKDENTGFVFVNCSLGGNGRIWLGRAWRPFSRVIFAFTTMSDIIAPEGWNDFSDPGQMHL